KGGACESIRPSSKPTFTTRRTPRCWRTACACSRLRRGGSARQAGRGARAVGRRVFEIAQRSRTAGPRVSPKVRAQSKARMKQLYQELMEITRAVLRQAEGVRARARDRQAAAH